MNQNEPGCVYERPWGNYQTLALENGFQIKLLTIIPGGRLSLQKHLQRTEHWIVVSGILTLTIGDSTATYERGQYAYVPCGVVHRIENTSTSVCKLAEVQVGDYLGEDDIIRLDDIYGRA